MYQLNSPIIKYLFSHKLGQRGVGLGEGGELFDDGVLGVDLHGGLQEAVPLLLGLVSQRRAQEMTRSSHLCHTDDTRVSVKAICQLKSKKLK